ncbi:tRNA uracil 4-sulfurtransferase ThiI [Candidatus Bipolaricaulota sp. J31]
MLVLIRLSGEITTKSKRTRRRFTERLVANLRDALTREGLGGEVEPGWDRIYVRTHGEGAPEVLRRVFGVRSLSVAIERDYRDPADIVHQGEELFRDLVRGKKFAVRARRVGNVRISVPALERELGAVLYPYAAGVDLGNPEVTAFVEVHDGKAYFFTERVEGFGGLPVGVEGRALCLISGGFDSAVAAWYMLKRGVELDYLFLNLGGCAHEYGALSCAKVLAERWSYGTRPRIHIVDLRPLTEHLHWGVKPNYWNLILRRLFYRAGELTAEREGYEALVTGEAVGQVSSQTLHNLAVATEAVRIPILRPLLGFDKEEIVRHAKIVGTHDISAGVKEYCAVVPRHPVTRAPLERVRQEEDKLPLDLLGKLVEERRTVDLLDLEHAELEVLKWQIDEIPEGALVVDVRGPEEYRAWHYPGAINIPLPDLPGRAEELPRDRPLVLYCPVGYQSLDGVELLRRLGYEAYSFRGGVSALRRYLQRVSGKAPG